MARPQNHAFRQFGWLSGKSRSRATCADHGGIASAGEHGDVLVGTETADDAGVYRLSDDDGDRLHRRLHHAAGRRSATLRTDRGGQFALGRVRDGGHAALAAVALCMFPKALEPDVAREILAGGQDKVEEAGAAIVGGHTVRSEELFYGLSVTGRVHPEKVMRNVGARPGDALVLTKPLGSGLIINGLRKGVLELKSRRGRSWNVLATAQSSAAEVMARFDVHAATDVTGFGARRATRCRWRWAAAGRRWCCECEQIAAVPAGCARWWRRASPPDRPSPTAPTSAPRLRGATLGQILGRAGARSADLGRPAHGGRRAQAGRAGRGAARRGRGFTPA